MQATAAQMICSARMQGNPTINFGRCVLCRIASIVIHMARLPPANAQNNSVLSRTRQAPRRAARLSCTVSRIAAKLTTAQ